MADEDERGDLDDEDEGDDETPVTRAEFRQLLGRLDRLAEAHEDRREADTPEERREAGDDVREAEDAFTRAARQAGLTREQITSAVAKAKDEVAFDSFKRMADRYFKEEADRAEEKDRASKKRAPQARASRKPRPANGAVDPDTGPVKPHWSQRDLAEFLR